ncbi:hypothetical protein HZP84_17110 [Elizabethkingia anophelis]|uniref:Uncharacterized protein n=2 Tax=Elizabethkingia anophelis TaxID=1117645 RepID=X5KNY5_9FLAO|nr:MULTISPECIES: hypothetical protein [Elizabethkingia]AKH94716.1 hypothetical protein M876_09060 [Elizabethkingia anophelis FMS-007]AMR40924.1 hypothetical protein A2T74_05870 [Elizabethkingia anophelis]AMX47560.1 hypothetical protein A4C56_05870 [Elizabethkingia anophelis]AMX51020.1 hypothetical protein A2T72_05870 [Elizabethkingia anophelis]AMX54412.1 hypothetical protein A2T59_05870 [Elizabethkingia anophelis]
MKRKSQHILNTSSNLLGFCLVIITSLKVAKLSKGTYLDDFAAVASLLLMASCILSFLAIRTESDKRSYKFERIADLFFIIALTALAISVVIIVFLDLIH